MTRVRGGRGLSALCSDSAHPSQRGLSEFEALDSYPRGCRRIVAPASRSDSFVAQIQQKELIILQC
ncbi:hypothetical protein C8259_33520 [Nocardia nova]|uniref:Uncharacterized protein n=2 Tax=Nocardia TaxID=1817 RepID=A0A2T2YQA0_9NOCA|nr:hypothetical protein C8259_33520 [Nocardia nova]